MANKKIKILFIAGNGRSGSTILGVILGQLKGYFAVGELRRIWTRGLIDDRPCGCNSNFIACKTWNEIFLEAYGGMDKVNPQLMATYRDRYTQTKHLPEMMLGRHQKSPNSDICNFLNTLEQLYAGISVVSGCDVIVDSSKWPMYAFIVDLLPNVELYVLHLVRDPRAFAYSFTRKKEYEPGQLHRRQSPFRSTAYWVTWNPAVKHFWNRPDKHYLYLGYEAFIANPIQSIADIAQFIGEPRKDLPFVDSQTVELEKTHAVAGNIARLTRGPVQLRLDAEWREKMPFADKLLVSTLTAPMLYRYGYLAR